MSSPSGFSVHLLTYDDIEDALALYDKYLGEDYIDPETISLFISEDTGYALGCFNPERQLVAAVLASYLSDETVLRASIPVEHRETCQGFLRLKKENSTVFLKSIITSLNYRKLGLASRLVENVDCWAESLGAGRVLSIGWEDRSGCHIQRTLEHLSYKSLGRVERFWLEDSLAHGYSCPTCGNPCHCDAVFFEKNLPAV